MRATKSIVRGLAYAAIAVSSLSLAVSAQTGTGEDANYQESSKIFRSFSERLKSDNWRERQAAIKQLGEIGGETAFGAICKALRTDKDSSVRGAALQALGRTKGSRAVAELIEALQLDNFGVDVETGGGWNKTLADIAADQLVSIGIPAVEALINAMRESKNFSTQWRAAEALRRIGDPRANEAMFAALTNRTSSARWEAARWFANMDTTNSVITPFKEAVRKEDVKFLALSYPYFIVRGDAASVPFLIQALNDQNYTAMAQDFINYGNDELEKAGLAWASSRNATIIRETSFGSGHRGWGSGK
jgi:HEAT repeat protein